MSDEKEQGLKWIVRYVVVPIVIALIGGGGICSVVVATIPYIFSTPLSPNPTKAISASTITQAPNSSYDKSTFAVLVGVTDNTDFSITDAKPYLYMASVINVDEAVIELGKVFASNDVVYVVHVPNLRVTSGNPGSCKLYLRQVENLKEYPPGWIIGGDNIVPDQFESSLQFCYGQ